MLRTLRASIGSCSGKGFTITLIEQKIECMLHCAAGVSPVPQEPSAKLGSSPSAPGASSPGATQNTFGAAAATSPGMSGAQAASEDITRPPSVPSPTPGLPGAVTTQGSGVGSAAGAASASGSGGLPSAGDSLMKGGRNTTTVMLCCNKECWLLGTYRCADCLQALLQVCHMHIHVRSLPSQELQCLQHAVPAIVGMSTATSSPAAPLTPGQHLGAQNAQNGGAPPAASLQGSTAPKTGTSTAQRAATAGAGAAAGATAGAAAGPLTPDRTAATAAPLTPGQPLAAKPAGASAAPTSGSTTGITPSPGANAGAKAGPKQVQLAAYNPTKAGIALTSGSTITSQGTCFCPHDPCMQNDDHSTTAGVLTWSACLRPYHWGLGFCIACADLDCTGSQAAQQFLLAFCTFDAVTFLGFHGPDESVPAI